MSTDLAGPCGSELNAVLGPLPEGREYIAGMNRHFAKVCGTVTAYSADDMRAYAAQEVAAERERWAAKLAQAEYLIGAFERGADAAEYGRDIAEFRA